MQRNDVLLSAVLMLASFVITVYSVSSVDALETVTLRTIQMTRVRMSSVDVATSENARDPGDVCGGLAKRVVIKSMPAGGQIDTIVTKARTEFQSGRATQIGIIAVRAEQNGMQISNGDIATPHTDLTDTVKIENRTPSVGEIAFYDETDPWEVAAYVCGRDATSEPVDISDLRQGSAEFYVTETR